MIRKIEFPNSLKIALNETISQYNHKKFIHTDPISLPYQYEDPLDIEIVSLVSCLYAYGNVKAIKNFLHSIFDVLGKSPYLSLATQSESFKKCFDKIGYYRFQTKEDNQLFLRTLSHVVSKHKKRNQNSPIFEEYFLFANSEFEPEKSISNFQTIFESYIKENSHQKNISRGLRFLIGDPKANSPKKRICLFLRWMVRRNSPDFGIYQRINPKDLAFPLDVHIQRLIKILGISKRNTFSLKDGILVRDYFRQLNPADPLLYDFYLTRIGMIQKCQGKKIESICSVCSLKEVCLIGSATGN